MFSLAVVVEVLAAFWSIFKVLIYYILNYKALVSKVLTHLQRILPLFQSAHISGTKSFPGC